jgi:hypothetical protein
VGSTEKSSFLVTLWVPSNEAEPEGAPGWRGSVEHLTTKRRFYFTGPNELIGFIARYTKGASRPGKPREPPEF